MSREKRWIISALKGKPDENIGLDVDWDRAAKLADHSRIAPLLYQIAGAQAGQPGQRFKAAYLYCRVKNEILLGEFEEIARAFARRSIAVMPLKGVYLLLTSLNSMPGARIMTDIDILIQKENRAKADEELRSLSFMPGEYCENINSSMYFKKTAGVVGAVQAHLHWHISNTSEPFMARHREAVNIDEMWREARALPGKVDHIRIMSPEHGLIALSEHGLRHGFARMDLVHDIHRHISYYGDVIDWKKVSDTMVRWNMALPVHFGIAISRIIFGTRMPESASQYIKPGITAFSEKILLRNILNSDFPGESLCAFFYLAMTRGLREKLSFAGSLASYMLRKDLSNRKEYAHNNMPG